MAIALAAGNCRCSCQRRVPANASRRQTVERLAWRLPGDGISGEQWMPTPAPSRKSFDGPLAQHAGGAARLCQRRRGVRPGRASLLSQAQPRARPPGRAAVLPCLAKARVATREPPTAARRHAGAPGPGPQHRATRAEHRQPYDYAQWRPAPRAGVPPRASQN